MTQPLSTVRTNSAATRVSGDAVSDPLAKLREFLETRRMREKIGAGGFAEFERELHERVMEAERDIVAAEMQKFDTDADAVVIDGKTVIGRPIP